MRIRIFGALAVALLIAACGGGSTSSTRPSTAATTPAFAATPGASAIPAGEVIIEVGTTSLGDVLVDADGMTLYAFTPDEGQAAPTCVDACAQNWPPVSGDATAGDGVDGTLLSTIARADGSSQALYGEYPLYHFAGDNQAGQTNGQGQGGKWFVVGVDGELIGETPGAS